MFACKTEQNAGKLIVITDDLALPIGAMRLRGKGSGGGHNGLKSIIDCLRTNEFIRLRIGIQPEHPSAIQKISFGKFSKTETETIEKVLEKCAEAIRAVISHGIGKAMAEYTNNEKLKVKNRLFTFHF